MDLDDMLLSGVLEIVWDAFRAVLRALGEAVFGPGPEPDREQPGSVLGLTSTDRTV